MLNQADFEISYVWNFKVLANKKFTNAAFESAIRVSSQLKITSQNRHKCIKFTKIWFSIIEGKLFKILSHAFDILYSFIILFLLSRHSKRQTITRRKKT